MKPSSQAIKSFLIGQLDLRIDYFDIYAASFPALHPVAVESLVKEFFYSMPPAALWLLRIREFMAKRIGLKTADGRQKVIAEIQSFTGCKGDKIALFEVWGRNEQEIVTGQKDKHLDFGLSFYVDRVQGKQIIKLITVVQINTFLGKTYFFLVKPIHQLLMPAIIKRLSKRLNTGG